MDDNKKEEQKAQLRLKDILIDLQRVESLHELIKADGYSAFMGLGRVQQQDVLDIASEISLDVRCRLAQEVERSCPR